MTFNNILKHEAFPLAKVIGLYAHHGCFRDGTPGGDRICMPARRPRRRHKGQGVLAPDTSYSQQERTGRRAPAGLSDDKLLLRSATALGNGTTADVSTVVYVRPENFNSMGNPMLAREIEKINREMAERGESYILIGPGRWGSSDSALGIPVKWPNISQARLIVETSLPGYRVEPSQGTHFFQNLTSMGVGYFTVDEKAGTGFCHFDMLDARPAEYESPTLRVVRFDAPLRDRNRRTKGAGRSGRTWMRPSARNRPLISTIPIPCQYSIISSVL